jgi:hypothetical protein
MRTLQAVPFIWRDEAGELVPADKDLHVAAVAFMKAEFGEERDLRKYYKCWGVAEFEGDTMLKFWGLIGLAWMMDTPLFHMAPPNGHEEAKTFVRGYKSLVDRAKSFLADAGFGGSNVFVHVSPDSWNANMLSHLLADLKAKESDRVVITI